MPIQTVGQKELVPTKEIIAKEVIITVMEDQQLYKFRIGNIMVGMVSTMVKIMEQVEEV